MCSKFKLSTVLCFLAVGVSNLGFAEYTIKKSDFGTTLIVASASDLESAAEDQKISYREYLEVRNYINSEDYFRTKRIKQLNNDIKQQASIREKEAQALGQTGSEIATSIVKNGIVKPALVTGAVALGTIAYLHSLGGGEAAGYLGIAVIGLAPVVGPAIWGTSALGFFSADAYKKNKEYNANIESINDTNDSKISKLEGKLEKEVLKSQRVLEIVFVGDQREIKIIPSK